MQLQALDSHLTHIRLPELPPKGWIATIRTSLGMSARQMAERMGVTQQSVAKLEKNEADDSITLKSLRKAAESLECRLVYAFVPNEGSLEDTLKKQAFMKAQQITIAVDHTMQLEGQGVGNIKQKTKEVAATLMQEFNSKLWDK